VVSDELCAGIRCKQVEPALASHAELGNELVAIGEKTVAMLGRDARERLHEACGDRDCIVGIEPVVRVGDTVSMTAFIDHALPANFEHWNADGGIDIRVAAAHRATVADSSEQRIEPVVVAESHSNHDRGISQPLHVAWTRLERLRIDTRGHDRFGDDQVAADLGGQRREIVVVATTCRTADSDAAGNHAAAINRPRKPARI
jgi:hypothetical protein